MRASLIALLLALSLAFAGCKAECVGCQPELPADAPVATAYTFEVEFWEMPVARAAALYRAGDPIHSSVALVIDERGLTKPLRELAARDPLVRRIARPTFTTQPGARGLVPARTAEITGDTVWSDGVRLELGATPTTGWAPYTLDFACAWTSPQGERLAATQGTTPVPASHDVLVWCLPSGVLTDQPESRAAHALVAVVRIVPRF
ncbi:MAG: hypothetical protein NTY35_10465 [Planctomycetota bacterium]|nr:hypothetical protein [Planctomycetota bacterium]